MQIDTGEAVKRVLAGEKPSKPKKSAPKDEAKKKDRSADRSADRAENKENRENNTRKNIHKINYPMQCIQHFVFF